MRAPLLAILLLLPSVAEAAPRLELSPTLRAFIDLSMVESSNLRFDLVPPAWVEPPPAILGGPTPADPSDAPSAQAAYGAQYALALVLGLGIQGDEYQDRSRGEMPGLVRNADVRGGYPVWSQKANPGLE